MLKIMSVILKEFEEKIKEKVSTLYSYLLEGNSKRFEEELYEACIEIYNKIAGLMIAEAAKSEELKEKTRILGQKKGLGEIRKEAVDLQLRTGHRIRIFSWFAVRSKSKRKKKKRGPNGSGCHLLLEYWGCIKRATPMYYSYLTMLSVLCPSFEIVLRVLEYQKIQAEYKRLREIAYKVGESCFADRVKIGLRKGENLSGKRVMISIDGGRTRTREKNEKKRASKSYKGKREKFDTPWREPKLFVIEVMEEDGSISKESLPIYDCMIENADACFELLSKYLKELKIDKAREVLFMADGALWIWDRVKSMLLSLGVKKEKIVEGIDYYHAAQHLAKVVNLFTKKQLPDAERKQLLKDLKSDLWNGRIQKLIDKITKRAKRKKKIIKELDYFRKNIHRMQYQKLRKNRMPCGSGIIESAIRRIINLRFKSASSFWEKKNVEKLIFLRGIFLAGRWEIMIENMTQKNRRLLYDTCAA